MAMTELRRRVVIHRNISQNEYSRPLESRIGDALIQPQQWPTNLVRSCVLRRERASASDGLEKCGQAKTTDGALCGKAEALAIGTLLSDKAREKANDENRA